MTISEEILQQLREEDPSSNYYHCALDIGKLRYLPVNPDFPYYINIYERFLLPGFFQGYFSILNRGHPFDLLCQRDDPRTDICTHLEVDSIAMEESHTYLSVFFPSQRQHRDFPSILLSQYDIAMIVSNSNLQKMLLFNFAMTMKFYGFSLHLDNLELLPAQHYVFIGIATVKQTWITENNHNYERITRMLKSLCLMGLNNYAQVFKSALDQVYRQNISIISEQVVLDWNDAISDFGVLPPSIPRLGVSDNVREAWQGIVQEVKMYFAHLKNPSWIDGLFKERRTFKSSAVLTLMQTLSGRGSSFTQVNIATFNPEAAIVGIDTVTLQDRLLHAGAVARGYMSGVPEVTAGRHSRLYDLLSMVIERQRQCVLDTLQIPDAAAVPAARS